MTKLWFLVISSQKFWFLAFIESHLSTILNFIIFSKARIGFNYLSHVNEKVNTAKTKKKTILPFCLITCRNLKCEMHGCVKQLGQFNRFVCSFMLPICLLMIIFFTRNDAQQIIILSGFIYIFEHFHLKIAIISCYLCTFI